MKYLVLVSLLLTACSTLTPKQALPELPTELAKPCSSLLTIPGDTTTVSVLLTTVSKNYMFRHECAAQLEALQGWYTDQKKIFDKANN